MRPCRRRHPAAALQALQGAYKGGVTVVCQRGKEQWQAWMLCCAAHCYCRSACTWDIVVQPE